MTDSMPSLNKIIVAVICTLAVLSSDCGDSHLAAHHYTVAIINPSPALDNYIDGFKKALETHGYREGENITYLYDGPCGPAEQIDRQLDKYRDRHLDLVYTLTSPATERAKAYLKSAKTPVLFAPVFSPVSCGLVDSVQKPGRNVTGIRCRGSIPKALEWFLAAAPSVKRIWVPLNPDSKAAVTALEDLQFAAKLFKVEIVTSYLATGRELSEALRSIPAGFDAVWVVNDVLMLSNVDQIVKAATAQGLPVGSALSQHQNGILLTYAADQDTVGQQAGRMAHRLFKGAEAADIPVETADFYLSINLKSAQALGLKISEDILCQADVIIR